MKSMTCRQLGGPCGFTHKGSSADEIIKSQDTHLKEMTAKGDALHAPAAQEMKGRWKRPVSGLRWYNAVKREFATLTDD